MARQEHTNDILKQADIEKLKGIMSDLDQTGQQEILAAVSGELTDTKKKQALAQIQQAAIGTDEQIKSWLITAVSSAYVAGINALHNELRKFSFDTALGTVTAETLKGVADMRPHLDAVNSLLSDAYLDFGSGITGFVKGSEHVLNDALKKQIQSKLALGRLTGEDINTIRKEIKNSLSQKGFDVLLDRGGKQWTLDRYSEMLARTHVIRANTEATLNRGSQLEIDVYEVSSHGADDALCAPQEGRIYSRSGKSSKYPRLTPQNTPPFHPNCRHTLMPRPDLDEQAPSDMVDPQSQRVAQEAEQNLDDLYKIAPKAKEEVDKFAEEIAGMFAGATVAKAPVKGKVRAMEKILGDYKGNAYKIGDLARNTIIAKNEAEMAKIYQQVIKDDRVISSKLLKAGDDPMGYTGANIKIKTNTGLVAEMQINTPAMIYAKEAEKNARAVLGDELFDRLDKAISVQGGQGHIYYEQWRSVGVTVEESMRIESVSFEYYSIVRRDSIDKL